MFNELLFILSLAAMFIGVVIYFAISTATTESYFAELQTVAIGGFVFAVGVVLFLDTTGGMEQVRTILTQLS